MSLADMTILSRAFCDAGTGPAPILLGSTHAQPIDMTLASGLSPIDLAFSALISNTLEQPAFSGEELPAVICPSGVKAGLSDERPAMSVSPRMERSLSMCLIE